MTSNNQQIYDSINHKLAIENQLNQEGRTEFGKTHTIHKLAVLSSYKLMGLVLKSPNCPDLSISDSNGRTALHLACERGDEKMVKILLESGAKVTSRDTNGYTPLHVKIFNEINESKFNMDLIKFLDHFLYSRSVVSTIMCL